MMINIWFSFRYRGDVPSGSAHNFFAGTSTILTEMGIVQLVEISLVSLFETRVKWSLVVFTFVRTIAIPIPRSGISRPLCPRVSFPFAPIAT